jgi:hypothetical protein
MLKIMQVAKSTLKMIESLGQPAADQASWRMRHIQHHHWSGHLIANSRHSS